MGNLISPKHLAIILRDQKFHDVLLACITDLNECVDKKTASTAAASAATRSDSETSHTVSDSPHNSNNDSSHEVEKRGTKRKRAVGYDGGKHGSERQQQGTDVDDNGNISSATSCFLAFINLMDSLYYLVTLANGIVGVDEVSSSHLKHALRSAFESVALVLGKSIQVAIMAAAQFSRSRATGLLQHLIHVLPAVLDLWDLRSSRLGASESKYSNVCAPHEMIECCWKA